MKKKNFVLVKNNFPCKMHGKNFAFFSHGENGKFAAKIFTGEI
jgi:hypothetical protein